MSQYYRSLFAFLLSGVFSFADSAETGGGVRAVSGFLQKNQSLTVEEQKQLAVASIHHLDEIRSLLTEAQHPDGGEVAKVALGKLKKIEKGGTRSIFHGATVGWYLFLEEKRVVTLPLIIKVSGGSAAAEAGLLPGDVVDECAGVSLKSDDSRNGFARFLSSWPKSEPLKLKIRRGPQAVADSSGEKVHEKTLVLFAKK